MKNWKKPKNIKHEIHKEFTSPSYINLIIKPFSSSASSALRTSLLKELNAWEWNTNKFHLGQPFRSHSPFHSRELFFSLFRFNLVLVFFTEQKYWGYVLWELYKHFRNARRRNGHNVFYYRFTSVFYSEFSSIRVKSRFLNKNVHWVSFFGVVFLHWGIIYEKIYISNGEQCLKTRLSWVIIK